MLGGRSQVPGKQCEHFNDYMRTTHLLLALDDDPLPFHHCLPQDDGLASPSVHTWSCAHVGDLHSASLNTTVTNVSLIFYRPTATLMMASESGPAMTDLNK